MLNMAQVSTRLRRQRKAKPKFNEFIHFFLKKGIQKGKVQRSSFSTVICILNYTKYSSFISRAVCPMKSQSSYWHNMMVNGCVTWEEQLMIRTNIKITVLPGVLVFQIVMLCRVLKMHHLHFPHESEKAIKHGIFLKLISFWSRDPPQTSPRLIWYFKNHLEKGSS